MHTEFTAMRPISYWCYRSWLACVLYFPLAAGAGLHHALDVVISPDRHAIEVTDTVTVSKGQSRALEFALHPGLTLEIMDEDVRLMQLTGKADDRLPSLNSSTVDSDPVPKRYRIELPHDRDQFTLRYQGHIRHPLQTRDEGYARGFSETAGMISPQGVFLDARSFWYPTVVGEAVTFKLDLRLPLDWYGMSQGVRAARETGPEHSRERWRCGSPQQEIYLIAGHFTEYTQTANGVQAMVLLRQPDAALAQQYLDVTADYVRLYSELIGPYPYQKFALVENFWETGYGMPSFTLLGSKVIRFPFILHSSYPHEILHNWWGNGVYVDYQHGNWAEGLTSYLADHLIKEQRGQGVDYRRTTLQKYTDYVRRQQDFPLTAFRSRHSAVTEAVGYGKTLMLFHMLRRELGDEAFIQGLRNLYRQNRFKVTDFGAVETAFSESAQQPLTDFFTQWVQRSGAPQLRVSQAHARPLDDAFVLTAVIEQLQDEAPYVLQVPLAIRLQDHEQAWQTVVQLDRKRLTVELTLPARPLQIDVDPQFDVFRRLHRNEMPPAISQVLGAEKIVIVLPAKAPQELRAAYKTLARAWQAAHPDQFDISVDADLEQLPADRSVWLFGWHNRFRSLMGQSLVDYNYLDQGDAIQIYDNVLKQDEEAIVVLGRRTDNPEHALGWLAAGQAAALPGLGRKLPHYGKYSYLAFTGEAPDNVLKGQWPVVHSPLSLPVVQDDGAPVTPGTLQLAPREPLVAPQAEFSGQRMQLDIEQLADAAMEGRGLGTLGLDRAAGYIVDQMRAAGLQPGGDDGVSWRQVWQARVPELDRTVTLQNVIAVLPGSDPARVGESVVIGAHYDHLGHGEYGAHAGDRGQLHPGADDNASGVAVLLALARVLAGKPQPRSIVFVAFTGEEAGRLGSKHFVENATQYSTDGMMAMVNLDSVGRLGERPLLALGTGTAAEWVHILRGAGYVTGMPVTSVADDIGSSDQTSFIAAGVPAIQLFAGVHEDYHRPGDKPDRIDAAGLVKTAQLMKEITVYLAGRPEALQSSLGKQQQILAVPSAQAKRRVSLGIVPEYAASPDGVQIADVHAESPAAQAGLRPGDIIQAVNATAVHNLREYTQALTELQPGDTVELVFWRSNREHRATTRVIAR
jgi:aminopeptidase N